MNLTEKRDYPTVPHLEQNQESMYMSNEGRNSALRTLEKDTTGVTGNMHTLCACFLTFGLPNIARENIPDRARLCFVLKQTVEACQKADTMHPTRWGAGGTCAGSSKTCKIISRLCKAPSGHLVTLPSIWVSVSWDSTFKKSSGRGSGQMRCPQQ